MSYVTDYLKRVLPKQEEIDYVYFKWNFYGGYALKIVIDGYNTMINGKYYIDISDSELKECLSFLKDNDYIIHKYSVVNYDKLEVL